MTDVSPSTTHPLLSTPLVLASILIAVLTGVASSLGLLASWPYAAETESWSLQAQGQDIGNLFAVGALLFSTIAAKRGSRRGLQVWVGTNLYLAYAMAIYAFTIHFGPLFLAYVATMGLSIYATGLALTSGRLPFDAPSAPTPAWLLCLIGSAFAALWLAAIIPVLFSGSVPADLVEAGLISNPVHVLDLALILPGMIATGVFALRKNPFAEFMVAPWLAFSTLMASSIVAGMLLMGSPLPLPIALTGVAALSAWACYRASARRKHG